MSKADEKSTDEAADPIDSLIESLHSTVLTENTKLDEYKQDLLVGFECPYNWKLDEITTSDNIIRDVRNKISELVEESADFDHFQWNSFILKLLLSYLLTNAHEFEEALELEDKCSKVLEELEEEDCKEPLFSKIKQALWHVTLVSKVYTLLVSGDENNAAVKELLVKIPVFSKMTDIEKAGVYGIKTQMLFQYGHDGNVLALESAKTARDLDPEMAEWWFLVGKSMGRIRRLVERMECVEKEEIKALERAVELQDSTSYLVFLAQTYRECSLRAFKKYQSQVDLKTHNLGKYIDTLNEKALNLYTQAIEKRKNCPRTMSRCAAGLIRLPGRYKRTQLAENVLTKALELAPENTYAHHVAGLLYYNHPYRNFRKALYHYGKAHELGNYGASMDLMRLKCEMDSAYDPYEDLLKYLEKYKVEIHQISLFCELGSYFLFMKRDLIKATEYYTTVIKKDKVSLLKANFVAFLSLDGPLNLLKIIIDEARLALQNVDALSKEDKLIIRKFMILGSTASPELLDVEPEENQIKAVLEKSRLRMNRNKPSTHSSNSNRGKIGTKPRFQGMQERRDENKTEQRNWRSDSAFPDRNNRDFNRTRGNNNSVESNWRTDASRSNSTQNNDRERLRNRCWRTEGRKDDTTDQDESYRFPVKIDQKKL